MIYKVRDFSEKFSTLVGDTSLDIPERFIIDGLNWSMQQLPLVPRLGKLFSKHYTFNLDAKGHYKWPLNGDFRRLIDIPMMNFYSSTGGEPCKINICYKDTDTFYNRNGLIDIKKPGTPCEYTIEQEGDDITLILDRPSNVPIIVDYIAYGFPKPITSMEDEIELSSIAENLILSALREVYYYEADDFNFGGAVSDYLDNKMIPEAIQALNKRWSKDVSILGEV